MNEFGKWAPSMGVVLYDGGMEERKAIRAEHLEKQQPAFNVLVTHYDLIIRDKNFLKKVRSTPCSGPCWSYFSSCMHDLCGPGPCIRPEKSMCLHASKYAQVTCCLRMVQW